MKLEVKGDTANGGTTTLITDSGERIELQCVQHIELGVEPVAKITMIIPAFDMQIVLPKQTGELLKAVALLEAEVARLREANRDKGG